jgi:hypothetical protein
MRHAIIAQIRHLQCEWPAKAFALELANGRLIQIYDPRAVATSEASHGSIGMLHGDGVFETIAVTQIVSVSVGCAPARERRPREMANRNGETLQHVIYVSIHSGLFGMEDSTSTVRHRSATGRAGGDAQAQATGDLRASACGAEQKA